MTPERWLQIESLYLEALDVPPADRAGFVRKASAGDEPLESEVTSLLAHHDSGFLETPASRAAVRLMGRASGSLSGSQVGPYRLESLIGAGGMGEVYRALDTRLHRVLAIKVLADQAASPEAHERFTREARAASALNHPNICTVYDVGSNPPYIAMEWLDGETLQQRLTRGSVDLRALVDIAIALTDALAASHGAAIVHRDIKPANIVITARGPKILDFGIAQRMSEAEAAAATRGASRPVDAHLTDRSARVGTASYMSPEQILTGPVDARTDIFSFGVVLYEMATGTRPFAGDSSAAVFEAILHHTPVDPSRVNPAVPAALARIIETCLAKARDQRYQRASDIGAALRQLQTDTDVSAVPVRVRIHRRLTLAAGAAVALLALAGWSYVHRPAALTEKDTLVVAEFTNTTGDAVFDGSLRQGLAIELEQSPFLSLVSDERVQQTLRLMGQPADALLTPQVAREVCERTASAVVLDGSVAALGNQYVIGLRARNCRTGSVVDQQQNQAPRKDDVLHVLSRMAAVFRTRLGESRATVEQHSTPLEEATTASLDALKAYSAGRVLHASNGPAALPLFQRAVDLDPHFAMAHAFLGTAYGELGQSRLAAASISTAYQLRDRTSDREKFFIEASYDMRVTGNLEKARQTCELWIQTYPRAWEARGFLTGIIYPVLARYDGVLDEGRKTIAINPGFAIGYSILAFGYEALDRFDDAERTLREAADRHIELPDGLVLHYDLAFLRADRAEMARVSALGREDSDAAQSLASHEAFALASSGQLRQATARAQRAADLAQQATHVEAAALYRTGAAVWDGFFGKASDAGREARFALQLSAARDVQYGAAVALALSGETSRAEAIASDLERRAPDDTAVKFSYAPVLRALAALNRGSAADAIRQLQVAAPYELGEPPSSFTGFFGTLYPVYVRGVAQLAMQHGAEAATEFQKVLDHRGLVVSDPIGALARLQLGRALAMSGDSARAKVAYRAFLDGWRDADADLPVLKQAQAEFARLR
jgi:serine/threonine protein kinase/tetratricopeptide (TPR) repeat protein